MRKCTNYLRDFITGTRNQSNFFQSVFDKNESGKNFTFKLKNYLFVCLLYGFKVA